MTQLRSKRDVAIQFKKQLNELYDNGTHILVLFRMYLGFLIAHADLLQPKIAKRYSTFTAWQIKDMCMSIYNAKIDTRLVALETAWVYTRRGGKSRGLTVIAVFFALLNKDVIWRTPFSTQLRQAGKWFNKNPFVEKNLIRSKNTVKIYGSPEIDIGVLHIGRAAGQECDILIYDEGGWVEKGKKVFDVYEASRPMIAGSDFKHIIHATTPAIYTAIDDAWQQLKAKELELDTILTSLHTYKDCYWISDEFVEEERKKHADSIWYVEQNYMCIWVVYGGKVFNNVYEIHTAVGMKYADILSKQKPSHCGVDFNAGDYQKPHYLGNLTYDDDYVFILDEYTFYGRDDDLTGLSFLFDEKWLRLSMEVEDGGYNIGFTEHTKMMGLVCNYKQWTIQEKMIRVQELRKRKIIIDKTRAPKAYQNFLEAAYDKGERVAALAKRDNQHGLDWALHAMHESSGEIYYSERGKVKTGVFGKQERTLRY